MSLCRRRVHLHQGDAGPAALVPRALDYIRGGGRGGQRVQLAHLRRVLPQALLRRLRGARDASEARRAARALYAYAATAREFYLSSSTCYLLLCALVLSYLCCSSATSAVRSSIEYYCAVVLSTINSMSVKFSTRVAIVFTVTKVTALVLVVALGFYHLIFSTDRFFESLDSTRV